MRMHIHADAYSSNIIFLIWALTAANGFVPKVTKSIIGSSQNSSYSSLPAFSGFRHFDILMFGFGNHLHISFDNGENWKTIDGIGGDVDWAISMDQFYEDRAFVTTRSEEIEEIHVTEDQGRSWQKVSKPREVEKEYRCYIDTHPFDRNLLPLSCRKKEGPRKFFSVVYASDDAGESFRCIVAGLRGGDRCEFAASSKHSTLESDGIYCVQSIERTEGIEVQSSNQKKETQGNDLSSKGLNSRVFFSTRRISGRPKSSLMN